MHVIICQLNHLCIAHAGFMIKLELCAVGYMPLTLLSSSWYTPFHAAQPPMYLSRYPPSIFGSPFYLFIILHPFHEALQPIKLWKSSLLFVSSPLCKQDQGPHRWAPDQGMEKGLQ